MTAKEFYEQYKGQYLKYIGSSYPVGYDLVPGKLYRVIGYYKHKAYNDSIIIESNGKDASPIPTNSGVELLPFIEATSRCWRISIAELKPLSKTDKFEKIKRRVKTPMGFGKVILVEDHITCVELDDNPAVLHEFTEDEISTL